jgi:tape measure domain-containing protein
MMADVPRLRGQAQAFNVGSSVRQGKELQALQIQASQVAPNTEQWVGFQRQIATINLELKRSQELAQTIQLRESLGAFSPGSLSQLETQLQLLNQTAKNISPNNPEWASYQQRIGQINRELEQSQKRAQDIRLRDDLGAFAPGSLAQLETRLTILKNTAREIAPSTDVWKQFNNQIQRTERAIQKISKKPLSGSQRLGAAGGAFLYGGGMGGGAGSALGGIAGGLMGGVPGAFTGAAVGQFVDNIGQQAAAIATLVAEINKSKIALAGVSTNVDDYNKSISAATAISSKFLLPVSDGIKQFTKLKASVVGAGYSTEVTTKVFNGIAAAIIGTGGSTEDLNSALLATSQVFSKGKVSAEELRGQIGERLPGAFTLFAKSIGKTPQDLDKLLQDGKVGLKDFIKFTDELNVKFGKTAETLAAAPENAGPRLKVALQAAAVSYGGLFQVIGAGFQNSVSDVIKFALVNESSIKRVVTVFAIGFNTLGKLVVGFGKFLVGTFNLVFTQLLGSLDTVLSRIENAINRAKAVESLTPEKITSIQNQARQAANEKYPGLFASEEKSTFYNTTFNKLIDEATGASKEVKYTDKIKNILFPEFNPTQFGGGTQGNGMPGGTSATNVKGLEAFEKLKDDLAKAYNEAEIERIKKRFELQKQLQQDQFDMQDFGANRLQKQNLALIRALMAAEISRAETVRNAQLEVQKQSGKVAGGAGGIAQYYTGDPSNAGYDRSHGTKKNYHDHLAFTTREAAVAAYEALKLAGIKVTEFQGYGKGVTGAHSGSGSLHHQGLAFDVPGYQWGGSGAIGAREYAGSARVRQVVGMGGPVGAGKFRKIGGNEKRDIMAEANTGIAAQNAQQAAFDANILKSSEVMKAFAQYASEAYNVPDLKLSNDLLKLRNDLTAQGMSPEQIDYQTRLYEIEQQRQNLLSLLPKAEDKAKLSIALRQAGLAALTKQTKEATAEEKRKNDETLRGLLVAAQTQQADRLAMAQAISPDAEMRLRLEQTYPGQSKESIDNLFTTEKAIAKAEELKTAFQGVASAIGDSFGQAFKGVVSGSMTAQEALSQMFQSIASSFMDMVAQMIASWLKAQVIEGFMNIVGAILPGFGTGIAPGPVAKSAGVKYSSTKMGPGFANGGIAQGGFRAFASGGIVTGPTLGLVGEGRYNEAVIPLPDGKSVPVDLGGMGGAGNQITSNIVVNVNSDGQSQSQQSGNGNAELGKKIEGAVKQVIVGELRPGGLLAGRR